MNPTGKFIWYELLSPNLAASEAFYSSVVGWTAAGSRGLVAAASAEPRSDSASDRCPLVI